MILDFGGGFVLRHATAADHPAMAAVCLRTGDAGQDASANEDDPDLLGAIYAIPYQVLEPDFAYVIDSPDGVCGYLLGAPDTRTFNARLAAEWYPKLQTRSADPGVDRSRWRGSDWARRYIHHPALDVPDGFADYPAHGHIDLLPQARGRGIGRRAMNFLEHRLRAAPTMGLHLQVGSRNEAALRFYHALGFDVLGGDGVPDDAIYVGKRFSAIGG